MTQQPVSQLCDAYALAIALQPALKGRTAQAHTRLAASGVDLQWRALADAAAQHRLLSITMSMAQCVRFLDEGAWLNVYEAAARTVNGPAGGSLGPHITPIRPLSNRVDWGSRRQTIERLLRFATDVHYASLTFGGAPEARYGGECCVVLDMGHWQPQATCFGGDPLRTCFDVTGNQVPDEQVLEFFAVADDWVDLLLLRQEGYIQALSNGIPGIDPQQMRAVLEDPDTMLEMHLHGPVTADQVKKVVVSRTFRDRCWAKVQQWVLLGNPTTSDLEAAPLFLRLLDLLHDRHLPLMLAEGK